MFMKVVWFSIVGSLINLDEHSVIQSMISRPLVACSLCGWLLGDVMTGFVFGILLELLLLGILPVGASMPINYSMVSILSAGLAILISEARNIAVNPSFIVWVLIFTLPMGLVYGEIESLNRKVNIRLVRIAEKGIEAGRLYYLELVTFLGVLISFVKGFIFILLVTSAGIRLLPNWYEALPGKVISGLNTASLLIFILGLVVSLRTFKVIIEKKNK